MYVQHMHSLIIMLMYAGQTPTGKLAPFPCIFYLNTAALIRNWSISQQVVKIYAAVQHKHTLTLQFSIKRKRHTARVVLCEEIAGVSRENLSKHKENPENPHRSTPAGSFCHEFS